MKQENLPFYTRKTTARFCNDVQTNFPLDRTKELHQFFPPENLMTKTTRYQFQFSHMFCISDKIVNVLLKALKLVQIH